MDYVTVYGQDGAMQAILENADSVGYELRHNDLWTGSFSLPAGDPDNDLCLPHAFVRLPDGSRDTGLYRIISMPSGEETALGGRKTYNLEHVMATLLDDVLFGYHEIGGTGIYTADVIRYILQRQTVVRWQLGVCEFTDQFQYHFENVSLLSALLSLGEVIADEYTWDFDTTTTPWTVSLLRADSEPGCGIYYGRNLVGIEKTMDASALVTRLYPLGYGEGVNQLTIREANNGIPYIEADTVSTWGVKCSVYTDTRILDAATLKARAEQVLEGYKNPYITYSASAVDLYRLTGYSWDNFMPGKLVTVMDGEHGIRFDARIVSIAKSDVNGDPGAITITIANAPRDTADSINTLADRVGIGELYSQGATNLYSVPFYDNADSSHPAKMRVYVPETLVRINKMLLSWQLSAFRAYETGASTTESTVEATTSTETQVQTSTSTASTTETSTSTPSTTESSSSTQSTTQSSSDGGGVYKATGAPQGSAETSGAGGSATIVEEQRVISSTGTAGAPVGLEGNGDNGTSTKTGLQTDEEDDHTHTVGEHSHTLGGHTHGADHSHTTSSHRHFAGDSSYTGNETNGAFVNSTSGLTTGAASGSTGNSSGVSTYAAGKHKHDVADHFHNFNHSHRVTVAVTIPKLEITIPTHTHTVPLGSHTHQINISAHSHDVTIPGHNHTVTIPGHSHDVTIPGHSHDVSIPGHSHSVTIPGHNHGIVYGIFEGQTANGVSIVVDGTTVPAAEITGSELDVAPYLAKDEAGRITRGTWHEIRIVPNSLTRIEANLSAQVFIQSIGGGDY